MVYSTFGLCLCCGVPFKPVIEDCFDYSKNGGCIIIARLERMLALDQRVTSMMHENKTMNFSNNKHAAHLMHKSHHMPALKFCIERGTNNSEMWYPFDVSPTTVKRKQMFARLKLTPDRHVLSNLYNYIDQLEPLGSGMVWEYELTVDACIDCNVSMTCEFWYRYLLYGNNPNRIIPSAVIDISKTTNGSRDPRVDKYPTDAYDRKNDYMSAYIAFFLRMCLPSSRLDSHKQLARQVYFKCCWLVLQVTCLICEYKNGTGNKGKWSHHPKSLLGAIELYVSYFGWTINCYQYPLLQERITFARWHQMYVWDLPNSKLFLDRNIQMLYSAILLEATPSAPLDLVKRVADKMLNAHLDFLDPLGKMIAGINNEVEIITHFIHMSDWDWVDKQAKNTVNDNLDEMLTRLGVRVMWSRVTNLSEKDMPESVIKVMKEFMKARQDLEQNNIRGSGAIVLYRKSFYNPWLPGRRLRGYWNSIQALHNCKALPLPLLLSE